MVSELITSELASGTALFSRLLQCLKKHIFSAEMSIEQGAVLLIYDREMLGTNDSCVMRHCPPTVTVVSLFCVTRLELTC